MKLYKNKYNQECYCFYMQCRRESSKWLLASQDIFDCFSAITVLYAKHIGKTICLKVGRVSVKAKLPW